MKPSLSKFIQTVFFFGLGLFILYWVFTSQEKSYLDYCVSQGNLPETCNLWDKLLSDFRSVNILWILLAIFAYILSNLSRALRWKMLVDKLGKPVSFWNSFWCVNLGYFANLGLPRSGEILRPATLARYEKIHFDSVMGTVVLGRVIDMVMFMIYFILALIINGKVIMGYLDNSSDLSAANFGIGILGFIGLILLFILVMRLTRNSQNWIIIKIRDFVNGVLDGIKTIRNLDQPLLFIFLSLFIWLMYLFMTWLTFYSFEPTSLLGFADALTVTVFGGLGFAVPSPGGIGTYQAMVIAALELSHIQSADALSFSFIIYFTVHIFTNLIMGLLSVLILPIINRNEN